MGGHVTYVSIPHRLEHFGLEYPNINHEWRTRSAVELLAVFSEAVVGEANTVFDFDHELSILGNGTAMVDTNSLV